MQSRTYLMPAANSARIRSSARFSSKAAASARSGIAKPSLKTAVHLGERPERFFAAALLLPKSGEAYRGAQFPRFAPLPKGCLDGPTEVFLSRGLIG